MTPAASASSPRIPYVLAAITAVMLWAFWMVADEVLEGETIAFDQTVTSFFHESGNPNDPWGPTWLEEAMRDLTGLGGFTVLGIVLIAAVIYLALSGKARTAVFVGLSVIGGTIISTGLKALFDRPRPNVEAASRVFTASFPSGHATLSAVVFLTLGLLLAEASPHRAVKTYFVVLGVTLTFVVGVSRVYLGVHYPTDVVAGWSLGLAWALACWVVYSMTIGHRAPQKG